MFHKAGLVELISVSLSSVKYMHSWKSSNVLNNGTFNCIWEDYLGVPTCTVWYYYGEIIIVGYISIDINCMSDKRMYYVARNILGLKTLL